MSEDTVKKHVQTMRMGRINELTEVIFRAEMRVNSKIILGEIARGLKFLAARCASAVKNRSEPYCVHAERSYMVKCFGNTFQVTILGIIIGSPHLAITACTFGRVHERAYHDLIYGETAIILSRVIVILLSHNNLILINEF